MNSSKVIDRLKATYPNKKIIALSSDQPTEILCEIDPVTDHPEYSVAVSVIDKSVPHYHNISTETYTVLEGELELFIAGTPHHLKQGESMIIKPGTTHYATGKETWVECRSEPGWTVADHISPLPEGSKT
jgi:mannose-6-phosphate isomerase-like protein (cupin superfamily)